MSTVTFIRNHMPHPVEMACKEMRMKDEVIRRIYSSLSRTYKSKNYCNAVQHEILAKYYSIVYKRIPIYHLIDMTDVDDLTKWKELDERINNHIDYAR